MTTQRTEKQILIDLREAREGYAALASNENSTQAQLRDAAAAVKALNAELGEYIVRGADPCECNATPMGMLKTPGYYDQAKGVDVPAVWEVGCVYCNPVLVEREDGKALIIDDATKTVKRRSFSARATTPEEAVRKWNEKLWVEDFYFYRMKGFTPVYAPEAKV